MQIKSLTLYPELKITIDRFTKEFDLIPTERKEILNQVSEFVGRKLKRREKIEMIFICTHNSRRSQISQVWAHTAATYYGVQGVHCYSGGTEATAFNQRAVSAMERVGFRITKDSDKSNPTYWVSFSPDVEEVIAYSKKFDTQSNPKKHFAAVMTCSHADENCPVVIGMEKRISLPYDDPKDFDGTDLEEEKYLERVYEIGREILYAFSTVDRSLHWY